LRRLILGVDVQFDTYREMRNLAVAEWAQPQSVDADDVSWAKFTPGTNALWIAYLCDMLRLKRFKGIAMVPAEKAALTAFRCLPRSCLGHTGRASLIDTR
jgi:hypothetical protein